MKKIVGFTLVGIVLFPLAFILLIIYLNFFSPPERLFTAIVKDNYESVSRLLDRGVDPNSKSDILRTPLTQATFLKRFRIAELLLKHGANSNTVDGSGYSPLMYACQNRDYLMAKLLLSKGANPNLINHFGKTAITIAGERRAEDIVALLTLHGAVP